MILTHIIDELNKSPKDVTQITLNADPIGTSGAMRLADAIKNKKATNLRILCLENAKIGIEGMEALVPALRINSSLLVLKLRGNHLGNNGALSLQHILQAHKRIKILDIANNNIGNENGLNPIAELVNTLTSSSSICELLLSFNKLDKRAIFSITQLLAMNKNVKKLDLRATNINDEHVTLLVNALENNISLTEILLEYNQISHKIRLKISEFLERNNHLNNQQIPNKELEMLNAIADSDNHVPLFIASKNIDLINYQNINKATQITKTEQTIFAFNYLPTEIQAHVFRFFAHKTLKHAVTTSKHCCNLAHDEMAYRVKEDALNKAKLNEVFLKAVKDGNKLLTEKYLGLGADINSRLPYSNFTSLHQAVMNAHIWIVMLLLDAGAHVNARDTDGRTPLHWAARLGHFEIIQLLINRKANLLIETEAGVTALQEANSKKHLEITEFLESRCKDILIERNNKLKYSNT